MTCTQRHLLQSTFAEKASLTFLYDNGSICFASKCLNKKILFTILCKRNLIELTGCIFCNGHAFIRIFKISNNMLMQREVCEKKDLNNDKKNYLKGQREYNEEIYAIFLRTTSASPRMFSILALLRILDSRLRPDKTLDETIVCG